MGPSSIGGINKLKPAERRQAYLKLVPPSIITRFQLNPFLINRDGTDLFKISGEPGSSSVELALHHDPDFPDPVLYGHLADTLTGKIHILLYVINNPEAPRFDVDRLPDGTPTIFGTTARNLVAEENAMKAGLAPGQIRSGLRILSEAIDTFEGFIAQLGHDLYYIEPLFYHNAVLFEKYGFAYQIGRKKMLDIQSNFLEGGDLWKKLDGSTAFRKRGMETTIRSRSWAIHDGLLGEPYTDVTMYKVIGQQSTFRSAPHIPY